MGNFFTRNGVVHPITHPKKIRDLTSSPDSQGIVQHHFLKMRDDDEFEKFGKMRKEQAKRNQFERLLPQKLGKAKILLISAIPDLMSSDPTLVIPSVYALCKFGKPSFVFLTKVNQEYKRTGKIGEALREVTIQEIDSHITSKFKAIAARKVSEFAARSLWENYKQQNLGMRLPAEWDGYAQKALTETFDEILNVVA